VKIRSAAFAAALMMIAGAAHAALPPPADSDWRAADPDNTLIIDTNQGRIIVELTPVMAPAAVQRIKDLVATHFYDGLQFFRVIDDFMDQTGDPKNTGEGGSTLPNLPPEFTFRAAPGEAFTPILQKPGGDSGFIGAMPVVSQPAAMAGLMMDGKVQTWGLYCDGVLGMARTDDPSTGNSQFFIMRHANLTLSRNYTAIGRVIVGEDVVRAIKTGEPPAAPEDRMTSVRLLSSIPEAQRPHIRIIDPKSDYFDALFAQAQAAQGADFTPCDVDVPAQVN
jgi:peptidylprolyl isomerase